MYRTKFIVTAIIVYGLILCPGSAEAFEEDPNMPDTVRVDSVVAFTSGIGVVPVYIFNDELLSAIEVTLWQNSADVVIDSFSFENGRLASADFKGSSLSTDSSIVTLFAFDSIPASSGLLGELYFSYSPGIIPQLVDIDTSSVLIGQIERSTTFSFQSGSAFATFIPQYERGYLDIQYAPEAQDSLWLNDASGRPGDPVSVEVSCYNEDDIKDIVLALDYGSNYLVYDSISFQGARPMPSVINSPLVQNQNSTHELRLRLTFDESSPLLPGSGIIAKLFFTIDPDAPQSTIVLDTTAFAGIAHTIITRTDAAGGDTFTPFFGKGSVEIGVATDVPDVIYDAALPSSFALEQNFPNPFNPTTQIRFSLPTASHVQLDVYNVLGRAVRRLIDESMAAGAYEITFNGRTDSGELLASGVYFYRLVADEHVESKKMLLLK